ncbi:trehalase family glycosidase [Flavobacterium succinicans]|uniref:Periplasmic trehalase n=1 Tax=Flavobacterium succinicans TaxID=29536 RepID=A0A199XMD2_9FLAO|nr:trehalase family glycosidase [Flavobacterium succinicans]OAZ02903.1 periplasmic trehalase precursor [Flavobacterium succinicans]
MKIVVEIDAVFEQLLLQEDTDQDKKITKEDTGPRRFELIDSVKNTQFVVEGTYHLSNLLQELAEMRQQGLVYGEVNFDRIQEPPVERISRKIRESYWDELTRVIDSDGLQKILEDEKTTNTIPTLYVSEKDKQGVTYFSALEKEWGNFKVAILPEKYSMDYVETLNTKPGLLALATSHDEKGIKGVPFVVPGGRFNEMYGWDSYFIGLGLLIDGKLDLAKAIATNFKYQIEYYGKILNANRSYYLTRTQPPLYSSLLRAIVDHEKPDSAWLASHLETIIEEYHSVWMVMGERLTPTGLSRYKADGIGMPFEVEPGHFDEVLEPFAQKYQLPLREFEKKYLERTLVDPELDQYFIHDRSMRESGHDTTNRLINSCANLNSVDINSFLYKYEIDIAYFIATYFEDTFISQNKTYAAQEWLDKAKMRKALMDKYCWNETEGMYFDYDFVHQKSLPFEAASTFFPLWAGLCSQDQAVKLVEKALPKFVMTGGIAGSTAKSIAHINLEDPLRQWDYPFGWAPHQMLLWEGLKNYGFESKLQEMVYRWLWLITTNAVDYNGTIPEKFDLEISSHKVFAEYGNVGTEFDYIAKEGFGWVNASYQCGLSLLAPKWKGYLNQQIHPDYFFYD